MTRCLKTLWGWLRTTVGAALRGRPCPETQCGKTGGHGGPPLQLSATAFATFEANS